jgi:CheY-like chemotaxis protein
VSLHYDQVRVCGVCYNVYQCLDWARNMLNKKFQFPEEVSGSPKRKRDSLSPTRNHQTQSQSVGEQESSLLSSSLTDSGIQEIQLTGSIRVTQSQTLPARGDSVKGKRGRRERDGSLTSTNPKQQKSLQKEREKATWKSQLDRSVSPEERSLKRGELSVLDNYIRGGGNSLTRAGRDNKLDGQSTLNLSPAKTSSQLSSTSMHSIKHGPSKDLDDKYTGNVLLVISNKAESDRVQQCLADVYFRVHLVRDGREAANVLLGQWEDYDCVIADRDATLMNSFDLCKSLRGYEKSLREKRAAATAASLKNNYGNKFLNHRMPFIVFTSQTTPTDLTKYMRSDMDGCISSEPLDTVSLVSTVRAAIPQHLSVIVRPATSSKDAIAGKVYKVGMLGVLEGSDDSSTMALKTLPVASANNQTAASYHPGAIDQGAEVQGIAQLDADTKIPFLVMNGSKYQRMRMVSHSNHNDCLVLF